MIFYPKVGKNGFDEKNCKILKIDAWESKPTPHWTIKKDKVDKFLKSAYDARSTFVHEGGRRPSYAKILGLADATTSIKIDKSGNPIKGKDGSYELNPEIPTYFWMERSINKTIISIISNI